MGYNGYLIKVGDYEIDDGRFIAASHYNVTRQIQDLDSYRDADGVLHRNALTHIPLKVEFQTPPMLTNTDIAEFMGNISRQYIEPNERKANVSVYVPELDDYITQDMYMSDPKFEIYGTYGNKVTYQAVRFAFIGY